LHLLLLLLELQAQKLGVISAAAGYGGELPCLWLLSLSLSMMETVPTSEIGKEARNREVKVGGFSMGEKYAWMGLLGTLCTVVVFFFNVSIFIDFLCSEAVLLE
jgi:hypothetical protein